MTVPKIIHGSSLLTKILIEMELPNFDMPDNIKIPAISPTSLRVVKGEMVGTD